jgi:oligoribonuclease NrnB/cAMP/cGMP phosphodiesterase (DHH superfamily)
MTKLNPLVIYHGTCMDGFTSAWICNQFLVSPDLHQGVYGKQPPWDFLRDRDVYIVDFSYPREQLIEMYAIAENLLVIDHHESAKNDCEGLEFCIFDMERSGAGLTWDYFSEGEPRPDWIDRVEDRDLWRFNYPDTKKVHAYMASQPMTLESWDAISEIHVEDLAVYGESILDYMKREYELVAEERIIAQIGEHNVAVVNCPYHLASGSADYMMRVFDVDYAMAWFKRSDGMYQFSLRSKPDSVDVSLIAKRFNGGGHKGAAGFSSPVLPDFSVIPTTRIHRGRCTECDSIIELGESHRLSCSLSK